MQANEDVTNETNKNQNPKTDSETVMMLSLMMTRDDQSPDWRKSGRRRELAELIKLQALEWLV